MHLTHEKNSTYKKSFKPLEAFNTPKTLTYEQYSTYKRHLTDEKYLTY